MGTYVSVEGSCPRRAEPIKRGILPLLEKDFSVAIVIMSIMRVLVEEPLCQD
jgi:hypothetical protein